MTILGNAQGKVHFVKEQTESEKWNCLMSGQRALVADGKYCPEDYCPRAKFVKLIECHHLQTNCLIAVLILDEK